MKAEYIEHMGSDLTVVNAARVSFDKHHDYFDASDERLVGYLARNGHWTPFAHPTITIRETIPIFVARQRIRHTVGFAYNEVSRRYVDTEPDIFDFGDTWRIKAENKKQGSGEELNLEDQDYCDSIYWNSTRTALLAYERLKAKGVCPEQARAVLPLSTFTSWYVTGSLAAWARAYKLRINPHAQKEIQDLAKQWDLIIRPLFPVSWGALVDDQAKEF